MTNFAKTIKRARLRKGLTVLQLSRLIPASTSYLSRIESSRRTYPPTEMMIDLLAKHLDLDAEMLLKISGRVDEETLKLFKKLLVRNPVEMRELLQEINRKPNYFKESKCSTLSITKLNQVSIVPTASAPHG